MKSTIDRRGSALRRHPHALVACSIFIMTSTMHAQSVALELDAGIEVPFGLLADSVEAGPMVGLGIEYEISPHFGVAGRGEISRLSAEERVVPGGPTGPAPNLTYWQLVAEGRLRPLITSGPTDLVLSAGAGIALFRFAGDFFDERFRSTSTHPTLRGGAALEVGVSPRIALTATTRLKLVLSEQENPPVPPFDETWFLNLSVGARIDL